MVIFKSKQNKFEGDLTLIWVGGEWVILPPPCWFFLNNLETVKAVTLAFGCM